MMQVGFYGSGITMDKARAAVEALQDQKQQGEGKAAPTPDLPFGRDSKRIFESAAEVRPSETCSHIHTEEASQLEKGSDAQEWCLHGHHKMR